MYIIYLLNDITEEDLENLDYIAVFNNGEIIKPETSSDYIDSEGKIHSVYKKIKFDIGDELTAEELGADYIVAFKIQDVDINAVPDTSLFEIKAVA